MQVCLYRCKDRYIILYANLCLTDSLPHNSYMLLCCLYVKIYLSAKFKKNGLINVSSYLKEFFKISQLSSHQGGQLFYCTMECYQD